MSPTRTGNVLSWASEVDPGTLEQAQRAASMPFVEQPLALMADAHVGKGATIGSVIATQGAVIPAAVGVDPGCGMIAAETGLRSDELPDSLDPLHADIARRIPAGVGKGHDEPGLHFDKWYKGNWTPGLTDKQMRTAETQFGSLGSGNHFVEVCLDESDMVWLVLHSGSRGIGNQLATQHIECAKGLMKRYFINLADPDLAYLAEGTPEFDAYITAMRWAQEYALANRSVMMSAAIEALRSVTRHFVPGLTVNCHHNFTTRENHHGKNLWVTRKGAIRARAGDLGVIPGSMGTRSYITRGTGSDASYHSSSHGAGRRLSRSAARKQLTTESLEAAMDGKAWNRDAKTLLDEHPLAYKDIDQVMADQSDLVDVVHTLRQVLNYKGS